MEGEVCRSETRLMKITMTMLWVVLLAVTLNSGVDPKPKKTDIECAVLEWGADASKPTLGILCPPKDVYAPLRVYMKVSQDPPAKKITLVNRPRTWIRLRKESSCLIWLTFLEEGQEHPRTDWLAFDEIVGMGLIPSVR